LQLRGSFFSLTQSPLHGLKPVLQLTSHLPIVVHMAMPCWLGGGVHGVQDVVPQLLVEVLLEHVPLQSCVPLGHKQEPPWQVVPPVHCLVHMPQLCRSVVSSTHTLVQMESLVTLHDCLQLVPLHVALPPVGATVEQFVQDAPHALLSFGTQEPLHTCIGLAHWHMLFTQCSPVAHLLLQPLQLLSSLVVSTQPLVHCV
jgi:hypothetical protein